MDDLEYRVDAGGLLAYLGHGWDEFAHANDGRENVLAAQVIGRPLLDFVSSRPLKHLWETLMSRVTASGRPMLVPFRCDAPGLRRSMQMQIEPLADGGLRFATRVLETSERPHAAIIDVNAPHSHERLLWMCSWCKRLEAHGRWIDVEEAAREFGLLERTDLPEVTHGLCPSCEHMILAELERDDGAPGSASRVDRRRLDLI